MERALARGQLDLQRVPEPSLLADPEALRHLVSVVFGFVCWPWASDNSPNFGLCVPKSRAAIYYEGYMFFVLLRVLKQWPSSQNKRVSAL